MKRHLKVIDLFAGVGGLSLGAAKAGYDLAGAIDKEMRFISAHSTNFPLTNHLCADLANLSGKDLLRKLGLQSKELAGIIGGPPCQGFSSIGKRSVLDDRNRLFIKFFQLIKYCNPAFFLAENVPGILNQQYDDIRKIAFKSVRANYHILEPIKIAANEFGAATTRTRVIFIGVRKDISGYESIIENLNIRKNKTKTNVQQALKGLPAHIEEYRTTFDSSWCKVENLYPNNYTKRINQILPNIGNEKALERFLKQKEISGCFWTMHTKELKVRYASLKQGQQDKISKSKRLSLDGLCPTLRAGTDSTKGSFQAVRPIHPLEPRVITPREAARLQGFPDWFQFHETKWHSFRLIGNSVCPLVSEHLLGAIGSSLKM